MLDQRKINVGGFTLVELLIVMALITVLAAIGIVSFRGAQNRARDAQRKADLRQYQTALEVYANDNDGFYPYHATAVGASTTLCADLGLADCSNEPDPGRMEYRYYSDGSGVAGDPTAVTYVLYAHLVVTDNYWAVCSDSRSGEIADLTLFVPPNCPL